MHSSWSQSAGKCETLREEFGGSTRSSTSIEVGIELWTLKMRLARATGDRQADSHSVRAPQLFCGQRRTFRKDNHLCRPEEQQQFIPPQGGSSELDFSVQ